MQILINGESEEFKSKGLSVLNLLEMKNVESPEMVAVQLNGEFVDKTNYADTIIRDDDSLEFLYFMGGGAGE
jgi:sulfur carrier protein